MRDRSCSASALQRVLLFTTLAVLFSSLSVAAAEKRRFDIAAGDAPRTLNEFSRQAELQIYFDADAVRRFMTNAVAGEFEAADALSTMLGGTGLAFAFVNERTVAIMLAAKNAHAIRMASAFDFDSLAGADALGQDAGPIEERKEAQTDEDTSSESAQVGGRGMPEILVRGSKILNLDIPRSRDDAQPYVVFDRQTIEKSGSLTVEDFLRKRLTSAISTRTSAQTTGAGSSSNHSNIDLRGLGTSQTLILVDGHRLAPRNGAGTAVQPDLNGIPLSAIERIEVLPATASGIYGGGATGGVINIVLRRDYSGVETTLTYDNTFGGGGATRRADFAAGFGFRDGRTNFTLAGSYSDSTELYWRERDFLERGRARILANSPDALLAASTPPLGGTTNIRSSTGANLTLKPQYGGASLGSVITFVPYGYQGPSSDNGAGLLANAGRYNLDAAQTSQPVAGGGQTLLNAPTIKSVSAAVRHDFASWLSAFVDVAAWENSGSASTNVGSGRFTLAPSAPNNPFNEAIVVTTPTFGADQIGRTSHESYRAVAGFIVDLPKGWRSALDHTWNRARRETNFESAGSIGAAASTAVSSGVTPSGAPLDVFRDTNAFPVDFSPFLAANGVRSPIQTTFNDTAVRFAGLLGWSLPAGAPTISLLLEHRKESLTESTTVSPTSTQVAYPRSQSIDSIYLETLIPLVSARNRVPGVNLLELQIAGRRDEYSITGANIASAIPSAPTLAPETRVTRDLSSVDPTVSLRYQPTADFTVRSSYGTGFLPPAMNQLVPDAPRQFTGAQLRLTDPRRGNEVPGLVTLLAGGNPDLRPEESESWSAGLILEPRFARGLRISGDWIKIEKHDNVRFFTTTQANLNNELAIPGFVTRGPPSGGFDVGPIVSINGQFLNVARQEVEALDLALDYRWESVAWGTFSLAGAATRNFHNITQVFATGPELEAVGLEGGLRWLANLELQWERREWTVGWTARYFDSYCLLAACASDTITATQGSTSVPSQTYHDLSARYRFSSSHDSALLANMDIRLGVRNIFDTKPPVDVTLSSYYSTFGDPRLASYYLSVRKSFF